MKIKCWKCYGKGRLRDEPLTSAETIGLGILSLGVVPLIRILVENDKNDGRFWHNCDICDGEGFQEKK